jgi:CHAT domain-containing protein
MYIFTGCTISHAQNDQVENNSSPETLQLQKLFEEGNNAIQSGKFKEAKEIYERLLKEITPEGDKSIISGSLVKLGFVHLQLREYSEAYASFSKGLEFSTGKDHRVCEGSMLYADGMAKQSEGKHVDALQAFEAALTIAEELGSAEGQIFIHLGMADSYFFLSDFNSTLSSCLVALRKIKELGSKRWEDIEADTLFKMGKLHRLLSRYDEAIENFRESGVCFRQIGLLDMEAATSNQIAEILFWLGDTDGAIEEYKRCLQIYGEKPATEQNLVTKAYVLVSLAEVSHYNGNVPVEIIRKYFSESEKILDTALPLSPELIKDLFSKEQDLVKRMLAMKEKLGLNNDQLNKDNINLSKPLLQMLIDSKEMTEVLKSHIHSITDEAIISKSSYFQKVGKIFMTFNDNEDIERGIAAVEFASYLHLCLPPSIDRAIELAKDWYYIANGYRLTKDYNSSLFHLYLALQVETLLHSYEMHWVFAALGRTYADMGKKDIAINYYQEGLNTLDLIRGQQSIDEIKMGVIAGSVYVYRDYVSLLLELYRERGTEKFLHASFEESQRIKARVFSEMLQRSRFMTSPNQDNMRYQMAQIYNQLRTVTNPSEQAPLFQKLDSIREQWRKEQARHSPSSIPLSSESVVTVKQVQAVLDQDSALLEYFTSPNGSALWVITRERISAFVLPGIEMLPVLESFLATLRLPLAGQPEIENHIGLGKKLYDGFMGPAEEQIRGKKRLIIAPDGPLHYLPFETLIYEDGRDTAASSTGNISYLINRFQISYVPSASVLTSIRSRREEKKPKHERRIPLLAFGDPLVGATTSAGDQLKPLLRDVQLKPLKFSSEEIKRIAQISGVSLDSPNLKLQGNATLSQFKDLDLSRYRRIHFATHAVLGDEVKWATQPAIILSPEEKDRPFSLLTFSDIMALKLNTELVTISACNTGLGKLRDGEGIVGLTRAFLYAGAASVIVSLWSVEDQSTGMLMEEFYRLMAKGETKVEALRKAKLKIMRSSVQLEATGSDQPLRSPFFWAPFIVVGEWN